MELPGKSCRQGLYCQVEAGCNPPLGARRKRVWRCPRRRHRLTKAHSSPSSAFYLSARIQQANLLHDKLDLRQSIAHLPLAPSPNSDPLASPGSSILSGVAPLSARMINNSYLSDRSLKIRSKAIPWEVSRYSLLGPGQAHRHASLVLSGLPASWTTQRRGCYSHPASCRRKGSGRSDP
jgi:hypothetical protein